MSLSCSRAMLTLCLLWWPVQANAQSSSANWPNFRGPTNDGICLAKGLPTEWDSSQHIVWKTALPGPGASSPVVWGDHIYITCYSGYFVPGQEGGSQSDLKRHLLCVDKKSGKPAWERTLAAKLPEEERIRDHGFAANSPTVDADGVICFFGKSGVVAYDHAGKELWQADVGSQTNGWGTSACPVLFEDLVFINASVESESLVALDRRTGKTRWKAEGIREAWNTPVLVKNPRGQTELVMAIHGKVMAFEPKTGQPLWNCNTDISWYMVPSLVAHDGVVYCLGGRSGISALAVRTGGTGDVTKTHRLWTSLKGSNVSSPVVHEGHLYWMNDNSGIAYCARADTGEVVYEERLNRAGQVYASALLADGKVYYLTRDGRTYVLSAKPQFEQVAMNDLRDGGVFNGSFAVDGQRLLVRSDKFLYAIGN
ncbi:MAG: PQQ-binding-like beta-propeller repeat protein [Pirellulaceae bacterium]|nr:PQQ-binding-like beta-propeller repeat protein [Pirellulaceae bacterium]